jgi:hypothetical protein
MTKAAEFTKRWRATPSGRESTERYERSEKGQETHRRAKRAWKRRNLAAVREHNRILQRVRYHVSTGAVVKTPCIACGDPIVHAHHHNGYAPEHELDVIWLCARHHTAAHGRASAGGDR